MTDSEKKAFEPRVYVKGTVVRRATTPSAAVALEFEGFKVQTDEPAGESAAPEGVTVSSTAAVPDTTAPKPSAPKSRKDSDKS